MDSASFVGRGAMLEAEPVSKDKKDREKLLEKIEKWLSENEGLKGEDLPSGRRASLNFLERRLREKQIELINIPDE